MATVYIHFTEEQKEQARHGEHMFPLNKYITTLSELYPSVSPHWHDEAELTLITEGSCTYQVHLDTFEVEKGDLFPRQCFIQSHARIRSRCCQKRMYFT